MAFLWTGLEIAKKQMPFGTRKTQKAQGFFHTADGIRKKEKLTSTGGYQFSVKKARWETPKSYLRRKRCKGGFGVSQEPGKE